MAVIPNSEVAVATMNKHSSQIATIRASMLGPVVARLDQDCNAADSFLANHRLSRSQLADPYAEISLKCYIAVLEDAAITLGDRWLGLHLGQGVRSADLGPLGLFFAAAPTVRIAFERMSRFLRALQSHSIVRLNETGEMTIWTYQIEDTTIWPRVQDSELTLAGACQLVRSFLGRHWAPLEVHFEHSEPENCSTLGAFFEAPLLFSQPANRLVLSTADLNRTVRNEDRDLSRVLERHIADLLATREIEIDTLGQVRRLIRLYIGQGRVTINRVARDLAISSRTLQRELARHNTSLRLLLREHRQSMAEARFEADRCHFSDLAQTLGYADATAFGRAFKSWTGETPRAVRNQKSAVRCSSDRPRGDGCKSV